MGVCVQLASDGTLQPTGQPLEQCTGYVLVSGSEYSVMNFFQQALTPPDNTVIAGWFVGCCGAVLVWYVVARMAGSVVAMFK